LSEIHKQGVHVFNEIIYIRGVAYNFQRGVTLCQSEGTHQIVMSFLSPVVGCLLKKGLQKGGYGSPMTSPSYIPVYFIRKILKYALLYSLHNLFFFLLGVISTAMSSLLLVQPLGIWTETNRTWRNHPKENQRPQKDERLIWYNKNCKWFIEETGNHMYEYLDFFLTRVIIIKSAFHLWLSRCFYFYLEYWRGVLMCFFYFQCAISELPIWLNLNCLTKQTILNSKLNYTGQKYGRMEAHCVYWVRGAWTCIATGNMDGYYRWKKPLTWVMSF